MNPPPSTSAAPTLEALRLAARAVAAAESALLRPTAASLDLAARHLESEVIPRLRIPLPHALSPPERASLAEAGAALQARVARLGRLLHGAAHLHAEWAVELAARHGYSSGGAALPLSVVRSAGRRCNLQA